MLTIIADSNIAHLQDYFNEIRLKQPVNLITMAGRDITKSAIAQYQPQALLIRSVTKVNEALLADNDSVGFVGSATIGTDHVNQEYLKQRNIEFANAAGCSKHSVAQYVITAILQLRPDYWQGIEGDLQSDDIAVTTESETTARKPVKLGVIGLGNIGSTLAKYAVDLGWQVLGYDPFLLPEQLSPNPLSQQQLSQAKIINASFGQVLTQSDVISLHVPLTKPSDSDFPTYHMIDKDALIGMPKHTLLINTARGAVISESALLDDLALNPERQVVLDVFEHEPEVSANLLNKLAMATPHIAGYTLEGKLRGTQMIFDALVHWLQTHHKSETVMPMQLMSELLPPNPYSWSELKAALDKASHNTLVEFYDIKQDCQDLMAQVNKDSQRVEGADFDALRKNYALRREWLFE